MDVGRQSDIADYFLICSGDNDRQLRAIVDYITEMVRREFNERPRTEGAMSGGWIVLDYGDVVIHIFSTPQREYYRLERLWQQAAPVVVVQ